MCLISVKTLYTRFNVSIRITLVKSDFISKPTVKSEVSNSKTALANEKEPFTAQT